MFALEPGPAIQGTSRDDQEITKGDRRHAMKALRFLWLGALFLAASVPCPALAKDVPPALIAARSHFFGVENVDQKTGAVDKDKVIFSWFSVQSYAAAVRGRVFLMDAYIYRVADTPAYVPTTVQEQLDLAPEAIFLGHGHGDHADNAAYIAVKNGATIFGAAEHCVAMQADAVKIFGARAEVKCVALTTTGSDPGSEVRQINVLKPDVCVTSFKHVHSGPVPLDPDFPQNLVNPIRDPRVDILFPPLPPPALDTRTTGVGGGGAVSMFYLFTVKDTGFSFAWHDTAGPLKERAPQEPYLSVLTQAGRRTSPRVFSRRAEPNRSAGR